jgi:putative spermidine/putrescine transport system ATP-binding protein
MTTTAAVRLLGVSKSFGTVQALKPLTLDVAPGEMVALLGPSGCGKTTTLRIVAGFETPDTGQVVIGERDVSELPPNRRSLGMVSQSYSLFPHMSVGDNVAFGLRMRGAGREERTRRARDMLETVRLKGFEDRDVHQLSGGQQQRVALARALVTRPSILLLDEPLGALDKNLRESMQFELRALQRRLAIASIIVTHDQEEALTMSDRVAVMSAGEIVQIGRPTDVYERPRTRFVSEFLGTSNIFSAVAHGEASPGVTALSLDVAGKPGVLVRTEKPPAAGRRVTIAVRPEQLQISASAPGLIPARIQDVVFRGSYHAYELALPGQSTPVFAYRQTRLASPPDGMIGLSWPADGAVLLADEHP